MRILIGGASGLLGQSLCDVLMHNGHEVCRLVRPSTEPSSSADEKKDTSAAPPTALPDRPRGASPSTVAWNPTAGELRPADIEAFDAVINLAGENIASGYWTERKKRSILLSRTQSTRLLAETFAKLSSPPRSFLCASAVGYYGDTGDEVVTEEHREGKGFLPHVCVAWEAAARLARESGCRVVHLRFGVVLTPAGGMLRRLLPVFRLGLGGRLGKGAQQMSWISSDDAVRAIELCLTDSSIDGPVNVSSPSPVTNAAFTAALGAELHRPTFATVPEWAIHLFLGQFGQELLLSSCRAVPGILQSRGFEFRDPELKDALARLMR